MSTPALQAIGHARAFGRANDADALLQRALIHDARSKSVAKNLWPDQPDKIAVVNARLFLLQAERRMKFDEVLEGIRSLRLESANVVHALSILLSTEVADLIQKGAPLVTTNPSSIDLATILRSPTDDVLEVREGYVHGGGWSKEALYLAREPGEDLAFYAHSYDSALEHVPWLQTNFMAYQSQKKRT